MFYFELVKHCQRMKYVGWRKLSADKLRKFVYSRMVKAVVVIQRWLRKRRKFVTDIDFLTLSKLNRNSSFVLYEDKRCFFFNKRSLQMFIAHRNSARNPFTNNSIQHADIVRLFAKDNKLNFFS